MAIRLEEGPFRRFEGEWTVGELGATACKIEFAPLTSSTARSSGSSPTPCSGASPTR
jgi:hypothetical protein